MVHLILLKAGLIIYSGFEGITILNKRSGFHNRYY